MRDIVAIETYKGERLLLNKLKDYFQLIKPSLSIMVVFSSVASYLLTPRVVAYDWRMITLLFVAGLLVTGSANAINQVVEKDTDAVMRRTAKRPVAAGRMSAAEGWTFAIITGAIGIFMLGNYFNWLAAGIALLSLFLYAFVYTPLKKVSSISVIVGAHFWAIAWIAHNDYARAGFKLLPSELGPTKFTAIQTIIYSLLLIPVGVIPYFIGMSGMVSLVIVTGANIFMVWRCIQLYRNMDVSSARRVMFSSYIYLPVVLLALLADKL